MEHSIDKSALITDLVAAIQELDKTPASNKKKRHALSKLVAECSYQLLFKGKTAAECLQLIDKLKTFV